jgi:hypothetical protein
MMSRYNVRDSCVRVNPHNNRAVRILRISVVLMAVCCWLSAAGGQPFPSFLVGKPTTYGRTSLDATNTRVAFGPDMGLVVWLEGGTVRGARVNQFGTLLDTVPIDIDGPDVEPFVTVRPGVVWGGNRFLVVWCEPNRAMCALIQPDGTVTERLVLQDSVIPWGVDAAAAFDGVNFLAAWTSHQPSARGAAFFSRVSPFGAIMDSLPRRIASGCSLSHAVYQVYYHDDRYLAVWRNQTAGSLCASIIMADGTVPDSEGFRVRPGSSIRYASVTHDSRNFIVAWDEAPYRVKLARVTDDGQVMDTAGVVLDTFAPWWTDLLSVGDTTLVVFCRDSVMRGDSLRVVAVRVDTALRRLDNTPVFLSPPDSSHGASNGPGAPSVAMCGDDYFVAWAQPFKVDGRPTNHVATYRRLNRQGQLVDSAPVAASYAPDQQMDPDVGSDGTDFLAAWAQASRDSAVQTWEVCGARFTATGAVLDSPAFRIVGPKGSRPRRIRVVFGGGCYLVVWTNDGSAYAARVSPGGTVLDSVPLRLNGNDTLYTLADIAFGDSTFLIVWVDLHTTHSRGVRVSPSGALLDTVPLTLQVNPTYVCRRSQVAFDGANFLVVRNDQNGGDGMLRCVRVNAAGQIVDPADLNIGWVEWDDDFPRVAYGGGVYFVSLETRGMVWRVSPSGSVLDSIPCSYTGPRECGFDGVNFFLLCAPDANGDFTAMRITPAGLVLDSIPFSLVTAPGATVFAPVDGMTTNDLGTVGLVCWDNEPEPLLTYRVRAATFPVLMGIGAGAALPVKSKPLATVVRGVLLLLPPASGVERRASSVLLDIAGRKVLDLHAGANDVSNLAPGVYFVREARAQAQAQAVSCYKVVIAK